MKSDLIPDQEQRKFLQKLYLQLQATHYRYPFRRLAARREAQFALHAIQAYSDLCQSLGGLPVFPAEWYKAIKDRQIVTLFKKANVRGWTARKKYADVPPAPLMRQARKA